MKLKLLFILSFYIYLSSLCFAKIKTIEDEFNNTVYYQSEVANISYAKMGYDYTSQIRFRTANGNKDKIILDIAIVFQAHSVFVLNKATLRTVHGWRLDLIDEKYGLISDTGQNFTFTGSGMQAVNASYILNEDEIKDIQAGVDMLRIELKNGFYNIKITEKESKKIVDCLNELLEYAANAK